MALGLCYSAEEYFRQNQLVQAMADDEEAMFCLQDYDAYGFDLDHTLAKFNLVNLTKVIVGALWLSGRVLDSRPKGHGFEPHRRHCVVSLSKNINPSLVLVQPRKTRPLKLKDC